MKIQDIKLTNFRNYENLQVDFSDGINFIYGKNGEGKTNLVESIYILALTKSFRISNDKYLIKKKCTNTSIEGNILTNISTKYKISIGLDGKKVEIDNNKQDKISDYVSKINVVLFSPDDTKIITESPNIRRRLLNIEISQLYKEYLLLLNGYEKILKHRNSYLKEIYINGNASKEYLDILTKKLIELGLKINNYRTDYINNINNYISEIYQNIFKKGNLKLKYISNYNKKTEDILLNEYRKIYSKEMAFGKTLIGIHHDELDFSLDGNKLKEWGSVGQIKNAIISFKLSEIIVIEKIKQEYPILILDDLFSELDTEKIENILHMLNNYVQTFITTTEINNINLKDFSNYKVFNVFDNKIREEK